MTLKVVELFAGIGAQAQALEDAGIEFTSTVCEVNKQAYTAYCRIHGDAPNLGDIRRVEHLPDCELLTYTFPCQDLSISGSQKGMTEGSGTRSSLLWEVGRLLRDAVEREREPEVLLMENVDAILNGSNSEEFQRWVDVLKELGYTSSWKILNAKEYGLPQSRRRCFMVSMKGGRKLAFPGPCPDGRVLADVLEKNPDPSSFLPEEQTWLYHAYVADFQHRGPDNIIVKGRLIRPRFHDQINRVYGIEGISPCLTACRGGSHMPKIETNKGLRVLTPRECWRLMGFPDRAFDRACAGMSKTALYRMAGNSIAVPCLTAIFRAIYIDKAWNVECLLEDFQ